MSKPLTSPQIASIPASLRPHALELLWSHLEADARAKLIATFDAEAALSGESYWDGLLGLFDAGELVGAVWLQIHPGRVASLHGPFLLAYNQDLAVQLTEAALRAKAANATCLVQALLQNAQDNPARALLQAGFSHAADLCYLFRTVDAEQQPGYANSLRFEPYTSENHDQLKSTIERTYLGSQDCPVVDGVRTVEDVLAGYRATGIFRPDFWQLATWDADDKPARIVGCLLLADQPATEQIELVYMGVVPEYRGQGFGQQIVARAIQTTSEAGRSRLVLAVDAANQPGMAMYEAAGFHGFGQRSLFLHVFSRGT